MSNDVSETARLLLCFMQVIGQAAIAGDPVAEPYLNGGAIRVIDGVPAFHKDRFLELLAQQILGVENESR